MAEVYERADSRYLWCWYYVRNASGRRRRVRASTGTANKREAQREADRLEALARGGPDAAPSPACYSVDDAIRDWLEGGLEEVAAPTAKMYRAKSGHIGRLLGSRDVIELTADQVRGYIDQRRAETAADHTIHKELVTLRRILAHAAEHGHLLGADWRAAIPRFRASYSPRDRWLTEEEYARLMLALLPDRRLFLTLSVFTGGRVSEVERIDWRDVDLVRGWVVITSSKRRKRAPSQKRHVPIAVELRAALIAVPEADRVGKVIARPWRNPADMLTKAARKAGVCGPGETLCPNDLRRTFASWMLQSGAAIKAVADLLGHGGTQLVERVYGHMSTDTYRDAVAKLPRFGARAKRTRAT